MQAEGLSASRLADMLDIQPSNVSHILSGRNKPGYDFLTKILSRFPKLNSDWLLLGIGSMYRRTDAGKDVSSVSLADSSPDSDVNSVQRVNISSISCGALLCSYLGVAGIRYTAIRKIICWSFRFRPKCQVLSVSAISTSDISKPIFSACVGAPKSLP